MIRETVLRDDLELAGREVIAAVADLRNCLADLAVGWPEEEMLWPVQLLDLVETRARTIVRRASGRPSRPLPLSSTVPH